MYDPSLYTVRSAMAIDRLDTTDPEFMDYMRDHDVLMRAEGWCDEPATCAAIVRHGVSAIRAIKHELAELRADVRIAFDQAHGIA